MLILDIIVCISDYSNNNNIKLLNKEINKKISITDTTKEWHDHYRTFFTKNKITLPYDNYKNTVNWKSEYVRISNYHFWDLFKHTDIPILIGFNTSNSNKLLSSIPKEIGNLINLKELSFDYNKIKNIPKSIRKLTKLTNFNINNNQIMNLPGEMNNLLNLKHFDISNNENLFELPELRGLNVLYIDWTQIKWNLLKYGIPNFYSYVGGDPSTFGTNRYNQHITINNVIIIFKELYKLPNLTNLIMLLVNVP